MKTKIINMLALLLLAIFFMGSYFFYFRYQPITNWQPQHYLRISGKITPQLLPQQRITWIAVYSSTNPLCQYDVTWFEGADIDRQRTRKTISQLGQSGQFKTEIPLDYYLPGYCDWRVSSVSYRLSNPSLSQTYGLRIAPIYSDGDPIDIALFSLHPDKKQVRSASLTLNCQSKNQCTIKKNHPFSTYMNARLSYQYKLHIVDNNR